MKQETSFTRYNTCIQYLEKQANRTCAAEKEGFFMKLIMLLRDNSGVDFYS